MTPFAQAALQVAQIALTLMGLVAVCAVLTEFVEMLAERQGEWRE